MLNYKVVDYNGRFAVQNTKDETLLKSKESSNIITFKTALEAQKLSDIFQAHIDQIREAGRYWFVKESVPGTSKGYIMKKMAARL